MTDDLENAFLLDVEQLLARGDTARVLARLRATWPREQLTRLLESSSAEVVAAAATCLGMTGVMADAETLLPLLGREDEAVAQAAEDALWALWMCAGSDEANARLAVALEYVKRDDPAGARSLLTKLTEDEADFAEAYHQLATVCCAAEDYDKAREAFASALVHNPRHFAAAAGLGHICVERGDYSGALDCYKRAVQLNPRLTELGELIPKLEVAIRKRDVA